MSVWLFCAEGSRLSLCPGSVCWLVLLSSKALCQFSDHFFRNCQKHPPHQGQDCLLRAKSRGGSWLLALVAFFYLWKGVSRAAFAGPQKNFHLITLYVSPGKVRTDRQSLHDPWGLPHEHPRLCNRQLLWPSVSYYTQILCSHVGSTNKSWLFFLEKFDDKAGQSHPGFLTLSLQ